MFIELKELNEFFPKNKYLRLFLWIVIVSLLTIVTIAAQHYFSSSDNASNTESNSKPLESEARNVSSINQVFNDSSNNTITNNTTINDSSSTVINNFNTLQGEGLGFKDLSIIRGLIPDGEWLESNIHLLKPYEAYPFKLGKCEQEDLSYCTRINFSKPDLEKNRIEFSINGSWSNVNFVNVSSFPLLLKRGCFTRIRAENDLLIVVLDNEVTSIKMAAFMLRGTLKQDKHYDVNMGAKLEIGCLGGSEPVGAYFGKALPESANLENLQKGRGLVFKNPYSGESSVEPLK